MGKLTNLKAFTKVMEHGSFAEAARQMGLSRAQVNRSVINLEDELGVQLLSRTTRSVSPTPAGEDYNREALRVLQALEDADSAVRDQGAALHGKIRLNAPLSFGVAHLGTALADFMTQYPHIEIELSLTDRFVDPVEDGYDAVIRIGELSDSPTLIEHPLLKINRFLMASPDFLDRHPTIDHPAQLANLPCLHYGSLGSGHVWTLLDAKGGPHKVKVKGAICANNGDVLRDAAIKGHGITMLPTFIAGPALQAGQLKQILPDYSLPEIHLMIVYAPKRHVSQKIRKLIDFLFEKFGDSPYWDEAECNA